MIIFYKDSVLGNSEREIQKRKTKIAFFTKKDKNTEGVSILNKKSLFLPKIKSNKKMKRNTKIPVVHLKAGSPLGEALKKMVEHKRLRERFWLGEISLEELNKQLREKNINKQYESAFAL